MDVHDLVFVLNTGEAISEPGNLPPEIRFHGMSADKGV